MKKKILMITTLLPYPLDNGGKIKSYNTINILAQKYDIDLICYYENDQELEYVDNIKKVVSKVKVIKGKITTSENKQYMIKLAFKSIFSKLPITVLKFFSNEFSDSINNYIKLNKYEKIYLDHLQIAINLNGVNKDNIELIMDEHNCEYLIMQRKCIEEKNILKKMFFYLEYLKLKRYEKNILNKCDKVVVLSDNDKDGLVNIGIDELKMKIVPIPFSDGYIKKNVNKEKINLDILFVGTMSWMPNSEGILWFLENVVPILRKEGLKFKLHIVGKGVSKEILGYKDDIDIEVLGFVEDIDKYIEKCDCMIVPIFFGSGLRVKIIEAFSKKIPVISTTLGAEGLHVSDNYNLLIADDAHSFNEKIKNMYNPVVREVLTNNARETFEKEYSFYSIKSKLLDFVERGE